MQVVGRQVVRCLDHGDLAPEGAIVRARDLARGLDRPQVETLAVGGLYMFETMGGDQRRALELAADMLAMVLLTRTPLPPQLMLPPGDSHVDVISSATP